MNSSTYYSGAERRIHSSLAYPGRERRLTKSETAVEDEQALVRRAKSHDRDAFALLYDRYVNRIFRYVYYRIGGVSSAEEVTERVFTTALETIAACPGDRRSFGDWLYHLARQATFEFKRSHAEEAKAAPDSAEQAAALIEALDRLADDEREIVILRFVDHMSVVQAAKIVDKSPEAVVALQYRALSRLGAVS